MQQILKNNPQLRSNKVDLLLNLEKQAVHEGMIVNQPYPKVNKTGSYLKVSNEENRTTAQWCNN